MPWSKPHAKTVITGEEKKPWGLKNALQERKTGPPGEKRINNLDWGRFNLRKNHLGASREDKKKNHGRKPNLDRRLKC